MSLTIPSPAKLNLFLHVVGQRPNGYHELQTVFQLLDYADILTFDLNRSSEITLKNQLNIPKEQNLIFKAARLLQAHTHTSKGAIIDIKKYIPMGGGLGGGSSNAATTLLALNDLWKTNIGIDDLADLGMQLGADVPVFARGHSAWGEGIGEFLTPVELPEAWFVVITPNCHVSTPHIFSQKDLVRDTAKITFADYLAGKGHNDLEPVVRKLHPQVDEAIQWLAQFAEAKMTGSGASVFASFADQISAQKILDKLPAHYQGFVARGINRSPLLDVCS
jgi:4-diphosphocytidyl-2-C-methyl-D-erythritol kinase